MWEDEKARRWWFTGFCDGEASFTYMWQKSRSAVIPMLSLRFLAGMKELLEKCTALVGGNIYVSQPRHICKDGSKAGKVVLLRVIKKEDLVKVIDHFDSYPLASHKQEEYAVWRRMVIRYIEFGMRDIEVITGAEKLSTKFGRRKGNRRLVMMNA